MPNIAIATPTQKDFDKLMVELEKIGATWSDGAKPTDNLVWRHFGKQTCIDAGNLNQLFFCEKSFYIAEGFTILTLEEGLKYLQSMNNEQRSEIISKENLKVGDIIVDTDGETAKVFAIFGDIFARSCRNNHDSVADWLTFTEAVRNGWKIQLPPTAPVKMTLAEIAKKLGHEVEVVK